MVTEHIFIDVVSLAKNLALRIFKFWVDCAYDLN